MGLFKGIGEKQNRAKMKGAPNRVGEGGVKDWYTTIKGFLAQ